MRVRRTLLVLAAVCLLAPAGAGAATGTQLDTFVPSPSGNGRGIKMSAARSSTAYYSTYGSADVIYKVNTKTHAAAGQLDTNLETLAPGKDFGALAWDATTGTLWGSEYSGSTGWIDRIDPISGAVTRVFDAHAADAANSGVDGLAVDSDGTLWVSGDGLGQPSVLVYHFSSSGAVLDSFTAPFANSGIVVDGDYLWLADIDGQVVHQYDKTGASTGVSFSTAGAGIDPEDLTIDYCSFSGKKAIWAYSSAFAGAAMAAYEIGDDSNAGCPADSPGSKPPGPPTAIVPVTSPVAGTPTRFDVTSGDDPSGTLYIYIWRFGDGKSLTGGGIVDHTFRCAGYYTVRVTVMNGSTVVARLSLKITVGFPRTAAKTYRGLEVSPTVRVKSRRITIKLRKRKVEFEGRRAVVGGTTYFLDRRKLGSGRKARGRIKRGRTHSLKLKVKFKRPRHRLQIKACFYA